MKNDSLLFFKGAYIFLSITISIFPLLFSPINTRAESFQNLLISKRFFAEDDLAKNTPTLLYEIEQDEKKEVKQGGIGKIIEKEAERVKKEDFMYANNQRYTITGETPYLESQFEPLNITIASVGIGGIFIAQHIAQSSTIWKYKTGFRFIEDGSYAFYADKPGHFVSTYLAGYVLSESLIATGLNWETSTITGALLGLAYNGYIEALDGYGVDFGFSPSDMYSNIAGAGFYIAQYYYPSLQNITPKFTIIPATLHGERLREPHDFFVDDYSSQTFYLSFNIHNLLNDEYKNYWPEWLELSVGYAARNLVDPYKRSDDGSIPDYLSKYHYSYKGEKAWGDPKVIFALDYNLNKILPDGGEFWNWLRQTLNYIKFPSPAIEVGINGKTRFFLLYPFHV